MKYIKKFNESKNSNLEEELQLIVNNLEKTNVIYENIDFSFTFKRIENKLNKMVFVIDDIECDEDVENFTIIDHEKLLDIQLTYDTRGIVVMRGFLSNKPEIIKTLNNTNDFSIGSGYKTKEEIVEEIVDILISNLSEYLIYKDTQEQSKIIAPKRTNIPGTGCLRCGGHGCIKCVTDYGRPWYDKILNGNNWVSRH